MRANDFQLIRQAMKEASGQSMPITMAFTKAVFENLLRPLSKLAQASARRVGMGLLASARRVGMELGESLVQLARFGTWTAVGAVSGAAVAWQYFSWQLRRPRPFGIAGWGDLVGWSCGLVLIPVFAFALFATAVSAFLWAGANVIAAGYVSSWPFELRVLACVGFNAGPLGLSCFLWFSNKRRAEAEEEERWQQRIDALKKTS